MILWMLNSVFVYFRGKPFRLHRSHERSHCLNRLRNIV